MKNKFLTNKEKQALKNKRAKMIIESFKPTFNKIKRLDENEMNELSSSYDNWRSSGPHDNEPDSEYTYDIYFEKGFGEPDESSYKPKNLIDFLNHIQIHVSYLIKTVDGVEKEHLKNEFLSDVKDIRKELSTREIKLLIDLSKKGELFYMEDMEEFGPEYVELLDDLGQSVRL